jgi:hypothetical protein
MDLTWLWYICLKHPSVRISEWNLHTQSFSYEIFNCLLSPSPLYFYPVLLSLIPQLHQLLYSSLLHCLSFSLYFFCFLKFIIIFIICSCSLYCKLHIFHSLLVLVFFLLNFQFHLILLHPLEYLLLLFLLFPLCLYFINYHHVTYPHNICPLIPLQLLELFW